jgi:6-phosphogluconolactonase
MARDLIARAQKIVIFQADVFAAGAAATIVAEIAAALHLARQRSISLMLAGGSTPRDVYREIARIDGMPWDRIDIFFGDERAVPPDHPDSNFGMAENALIGPLGLNAEKVHRMEAEHSDLEAAARDYERGLPDPVDILLLGIGTDGHTASLFPASPLLTILDRDVGSAESPAHEHRRMTILPRVIQRASTCIMLAASAAKADAVACALDPRTTLEDCPAALARQAIWVLDRDAAARLEHS